MKKLFLFFAAILVAGSMWAQTPDWSVTSFSGTISNNSLTINNATLTFGDFTVGKGEPTVTINGGKLKFGSSKNQFWSSYSISTDAFNDKNITKVEVGCYDNGNTTSTITATQGSVQIGTATVNQTGSAKDITLNTTSGAGGTLKLTYSSTAQASYISYIKVYYATSGGDGDGDDDGGSVDPVDVEQEYAIATFNGKTATYTTGWTTTGTGLTRTDCVIIGTGENITSPAFDLSKFTSVTVKFSGRRYGTLTGSKATVDLSIGGTSMGTLNIDNGSVDDVDGGITFTPTPGMTAAQMVFTCTNASSAGSTHGAGIGTIKIYAKIGTITVSKAQYATYYNAANAYYMPEGLEGITVEGVSGTALTLNNTHYGAGDIVPAREALILHGAATTYTLYAGTTTNSKITNNILKGTSTANDWTIGNAGDVFYRLSQHDGQVGFYYGADGGAAFKPGANKAYLAISSNLAPSYFLFNDTEEGIMTGVASTEAVVETGKFIENGQLIIVKDGVRYNSVGQIVR